MVASRADNEVFLDASCLIALIHERDALHARAAEVMDGLGHEQVPLSTSDWVLAEFLAGASAVSLRLRAVEFVETLQAASNVTVVPATRRGFLDAIALYRSHRDKQWSLVDCSSMLICRSRRIKRVFTHDRHFTQAGFRALLR